MFRFLSAKNHPFLRLMPLLLGVFLISLAIPALTPTVQAATLASTFPHSGGGGCPQGYTYGTSYDADTITSQDDTGNLYTISSEQWWSPSLAAVICGLDTGFWMESNFAGASSYNLAYTVNNQRTVVTLNNSSIGIDSNDHIRFLVGGFSLHQVYTFQIQACYANYGCTYWSPHVTINTYTNITCQNGYTFRGAYAWDQVCVTSEQATQVALDNSLAASRVDPNGASGPKSCISGYVWRDAIGADYVCVTPGERAQVWSDNSQSSAHILQI